MKIKEWFCDECSRKNDGFNCMCGMVWSEARPLYEHGINSVKTTEKFMSIKPGTEFLSNNKVDGKRLRLVKIKPILDAGITDLFVCVIDTGEIKHISYFV